MIVTPEPAPNVSVPLPTLRVTCIRLVAEASTSSTCSVVNVYVEPGA